MPRRCSGTLLSIKPIIDISSGKVEEAGRARTRRKALDALAAKVLEHSPVEDLAVMHGQAPDLDDFLALLAPTYGRDDIRDRPHRTGRRHPRRPPGHGRQLPPAPLIPPPTAV